MLRQAQHERDRVLHRLSCHLDTPAPKDVAISCGVSRRADILTLGFRATGPMSGIRWPGVADSGHDPWTQRDELWRHSCFEVFGGMVGGTEYYEGNFTTSGEWAAYGFSAPRLDMRNAHEVTLLAANWRRTSMRVDLNAVLQMPQEFARSDLRIALSAVIEETDGTKSYWALRHPPGKPDFHHPDCFALQLPALG